MPEPKIYWSTQTVQNLAARFKPEPKDMITSLQTFVCSSGPAENNYFPIRTFFHTVLDSGIHQIVFH